MYTACREVFFYKSLDITENSYKSTKCTYTDCCRGRLTYRNICAIKKRAEWDVEIKGIW